MTRTLDAETRARFAEGVAIANIPTLLMVLVQMTGDRRWLAPPYRCGRGRGLEDNDDGGLSPEAQAEVRRAALAAILAWAEGAPVALPVPDAETLREMLEAAMGEPIPADYGPIIAAGLGLTPGPGARGQGARGRARGLSRRHHRRRHVRPLRRGAAAGGRHPFVILEKSDEVGGTWWENRYPGAGVDTPNHLYSFSFAQFDWAHYFALRPDLHAYFRRVAEQFDLIRQIRFRHRVTRTTFDETAMRWRLEVAPEGAAPYTLDADIVISAVGVLNVPKVPPIKGLETFPGPKFHTAEWPEGTDLSGKRVGIVGNGASAMQIVPAIAPEVGRLTVFARSKHWAAPFEQFRREVPEPVRFLLREVPLYQAWYRQRLAWTFNDRVHASLQKDPAWPAPERALNATNDAHRQFFTAYVKRELGDRQDLLDKVLPDYPPFGKRMLLDNGWYRAVARPNVTLADSGLKEVRGSTLIDGNGEAHEVDVLILATGFHAAEFLRTFEVTGLGGRVLREEWRGDDARAYMGTTVPGFPNLFTLLGPNIGLGHGGSVIAPIEAQMDYVMDLIGQMFARGAQAVDVRREAHDAYNERVDAAHERMVWTHPGMDNWYRNSRGRVVAITPFRHDDWWRMTRRAKLEDYRLLHASRGGEGERMSIIIEPAPEAPGATDPRMPARDRVVTRSLIDRLARETPDKVFVKFDDDGEEWTYARFRELVAQTALGLQRLGIGMGDHVLVWGPNGREQIRVYFALNFLGAVYVPINTAYRGSLLAHVVKLSDAKLAVVHASLLDRLDEVDTAALERIVVWGGAATVKLPTLPYAEALLPDAGRLTATDRPIEPWDPMAIIFTSGTTGPSKAVLASYMHLWSNAGPESWPFVTGEDRFLVMGPMFHILGMGPMYVMLTRGGSMGFADRFDTARFWDTVRHTECTATFLLGVMATFLEKAPPQPDDAANPMRLAMMVPLSEDVEGFSRRFGVDVRTIFNMTEISTPIWSEVNPTKRGTCGKPREGVEVRLVDENDCEVATGKVGEMMIRTERPWAMNSGYYKNPEATAKAWRNGWFHTGDAFTRDEEGNFYFVDRIKDAIRRRGENISSFEVEADVTAHPDVRECAAIGVPSELGEDEVMVVVAPVEGRTVDPAALIEFLTPRMSYFMVPRYVRVLPELAKTPSGKVLKHELRAEGITPDTWDREAAGIRLKAERFGETA
jgi:acyl-CoA synthetase (AMP-forming)/AMP-acid ligase II/cation diffusion facilitator CzcD-associated flavoprotein CzcO